MRTQAILRTSVPQGRFREPAWVLAFAGTSIAAGILCLRIVSDSRLFNRVLGWHASADPVGRIFDAQGGVRIRPASDVIWYDIPKGGEQVVAEGDTVFTNPMGTVALELPGATVARLRPNSLVVVRLARKDKGIGSAWFSKLVRPLLGLSSGAAASLAVEKDAIQLELREGEDRTELDFGDRKLEIGSAGDGNGRIEVTRDPSRPEVAATLSADPSSKLEIIDPARAGPSARVSLDAGSMATLAQDPGQGVAVTRPVYRPVFPQDGERVRSSGDAGDGRKPVVFSWEWTRDPDLGEQARLEIEGGDRTAIDLSRRDRRKSVGLKPGEYRWRIALARGDRWEEAPWARFVLDSLSPPKLMGPSDGLVVRAKDAQAPERSAVPLAQVRLSWAAVDDDMRAEVELVRKGGRDRTVRQGQAAGIELSLPPGEYRWRVRQGAPQGGRSSPWSEPRRLHVTRDAVRVEEAVATALKTAPIPIVADPRPHAAPAGPAASPPSALTPPALQTRSQPQTQGRALALSKLRGLLRVGPKGASLSLHLDAQVQPVEGGASYRFRLIRSDGRIAREWTGSRPSLDARVEPFEEGAYQVEAAASLNGGETLSSGRHALTVEVPPVSLKEPLSGAEQKFGERVIMTWERTPMTESYQIQVSTDSQFGSLVLDERSSSNLRFFVPKAAGTFYWRARSIGKSIRGEWSRPSSFVVK